MLRFGLFWQPDSKLLLDLAKINMVCLVDVTLQSNRWYHVAITGGVGHNMQIWLNGVDTKTSCFKDVSTILSLLLTRSNIPPPVLHS